MNYSHHSLDTFSNCPRKFKFQYIERVDIPARVPADQYLGNAVHLTLRHLYERVADGVEWPLEQLLAFYDEQWEKPERKEIEVLKEYMTVDDYIRNGRTMLQTYYDKYKPFRNGTVLGIELDLSAQLPDTDFRIKGRIDRLWKRPDGVVEICDYKTGSSLPRGGADPRFLSQMGMYQWLVRLNYPQFTNIELVQYYLKSDEVISYRATEDQLAELCEQVRLGIIATIQAGKLDNFPTKEGSLCDYCEYFKLCPAKRHKQILDAEAGKAGKAEKSSAEVAVELADKFLEIDRQKKEVEAAHDALKSDLVQLARELRFDKLEGQLGSVSVKIGREEKFPTRSRDAEGFLNLSALARRYQLDTCFTLDTNALKDLYLKRRLSVEQLKELAEFVRVEETSRVTTRRKKSSQDDTED